MSNKINKHKYKKHNKFTKKLKPVKGGYLSTITPYKNVAGENILPIPGTDLDLQYFYGLGSNPPKNITTPGKTIEYKTHENGNRDAVQFMFPMYNFKLNFAKKLKDKVDSYAILKQFEGDESYYIVSSNNYNPETSKFLLLEDDLSLQEIPNPTNPANQELIKDDNVNYKNTNNAIAAIDASDTKYYNFYNSKLFMNDIKDLLLTKIKMYKDPKPAKNNIFELISNLYRYYIQNNVFLIDVIKYNNNIFILLLFLNEIHTFYKLFNKCISELKQKKDENKITEESHVGGMTDFIKKNIQDFFLSNKSKISYAFNYFKFINEFKTEDSKAKKYETLLKQNLNNVFDNFIETIKDLLILILKIEFSYPSLCKYIISDFVLRVLDINYIPTFLLSKRKIWTTLFNTNEIYKLDDKMTNEDEVFNKTNNNNLDTNTAAIYKGIKFAPCSEISLFKLFIYLLDKKITGFIKNNEDDIYFNLEKLKKNTPIYNFFEKYKTFDNLKEKFKNETAEKGNEILNEWVALLSELPDIYYAREAKTHIKCELGAREENILKVLNILINPDKKFLSISECLKYFFKQPPHIENDGKGKYIINNIFTFNMEGGHCSLVLKKNLGDLTLLRELDDTNNMQIFDFINKLNNYNYDIFYYIGNMYVNFVKYLIEKGTDINSVNKKNETLLIYTIKSYIDYTNTLKKYELVRFFVDKSSNFNTLDAEGNTALMCLLKDITYSFINTEIQESIKKIIDKGADINTTNDINGMTVLMYLMIINIYNENDTKRIIYLINNVIDINAIDKQGKTALMYGIDKNINSEIIDNFIEKGANFNHIDNNGKTTLMYLLDNYTYGKKKIVEYLLVFLIEEGNDINAIDKKGKTVLEYAKKLLLEHPDKDKILDILTPQPQLEPQTQLEPQPEPQLASQPEQLPSGGNLSKYKSKSNRKLNRKLKTKEKHKSKYKTKIHKLKYKTKIHKL